MIAVVDANNDGHQDLVGTWASGLVTAYLNTGAPGGAGFGLLLSIDSGWSDIAKIVVADADNDGKQDLVVIRASGLVTAYLNTGTLSQPAFGNPRNVCSGWNTITRIATVR